MLNQPHAPHLRAHPDFTALRFIRDALAVRLTPTAEATRESLRSFVGYPLSTCRPLRPREALRLLAPSSFADNAGLRPVGTVSALPTAPTLRFSWGVLFSGLNYGSLSLRPVRFARPPVGADQVFTQPTGTFTSGLSTDWSPAPPPALTTVATGQVPLTGFSPARNAN